MGYPALIRWFIAGLALTPSPLTLTYVEANGKITAVIRTTATEAKDVYMQSVVHLSVGPANRMGHDLS